jgi:hypothetical protein
MKLSAGVHQRLEINIIFAELHKTRGTPEKLQPVAVSNFRVSGDISVDGDSPVDSM